MITITLSFFLKRCLPLSIYGWLGKIQWKKEDFYSHLNMVDITDADYSHAKKNCKNFEINTLGEYYDLHL